MFKVREMSRLLGVDRSFLHYYDQIGIIVPDKNEKNYRLYNENDLIALASSKYYRSMETPLKELSEVILESGFEEKVRFMERQRQYLREKATLYADMAIVADYALEMYHSAYQDGVHGAASVAAFEFVPVVRNGTYDKEFLVSEPVRALLDFFPFVSYTYYFPQKAIIDENAFCFELGLSVIPDFRRKYGLALPKGSVCRPKQPGISFALSKNIDSVPFVYDDFEAVREYARAEGISLTGEGIAYCIFSNYELERGEIKFVIYFS